MQDMSAELQRGQEKNKEKYEAYKAMACNLNKAMRSGFYYQAIFIEYAMMEDRCTSVLKHAGVRYLDNKGYEIRISDKLKKIRNQPVFSCAYVRQRITLDLLDELMAWKGERDRLIHALARIPYDYEAVKAVAVRGQELVRILDNKVRSVNNYLDKRL